MEEGRRNSAAFVMSTFDSSPAALTESTPRALLAPPFNRHADWRRLPDAAVARVLDRLPVLDLFRLGYLFSPRWIHIWRRLPLYLHDRQFTTPPIPAGYVAQAITNVLELHVGNGVQFVPVQGGGGGGGGGHGGNEVAAPDGGGADVSSDEEYGIYDDVIANDGVIRNGGYEIGRVFCFRVETTRWSLEHLNRWCAALQRGLVRDVVLANLHLPGYPSLPRALLDCTSLLELHVFFFTVEAYHIDRLRVLGLYSCVWGLGMIERAIHSESEIRELAIDGAEGPTFPLAATRLRSLRMYDIQVGTVAVDNATQLRNLYMHHTRTSKLTINGAPRLRRIISLDLFNTVLEIQGIVIQAGMVEQPPQIRSVRYLGIQVNYTTMVDMVPRGIEQILKSFPRVKSLNILRCDDVTQAEGLLQWNDVHYDGNNFFHGLESFNYHLRWIYLTGFRGGKCEVALMKAMLDKVRVLTLLRMEYSTSSLPELTLNQLDSSLRIFKTQTPNDAVRGDRVSFVAADGCGTCVRLAA